QQVAHYKPKPPKYFVEDPQIGDYPNLPVESKLDRPALGWWDLQNRRNYGETLHEEEEALSVWGFDVYDYDASTSLRQLFIFFSGIGVLSYIIAKNMPERPALPKTFPYDNMREELRKLDDLEDGGPSPHV
ncbi:15849_t:CDS:2, partial [Acaulospora colombiana]